MGHQITFAEPDIYGRQQKRDAGEIDYATVRVYQTPSHLNMMLAEACAADLIIKHSGVGADDEFLEAAVLDCKTLERKVAFWDVDAPATLARVELNPADAFRDLIPQYDFIFTYGGGAPVIEHYKRLGARNCVPVYNGLDPDTHRPVDPDPAVQCDLAFVGHRLPDREKRVNDFFFAAAEQAPEFSFVLGGEGWGGTSSAQQRMLDRPRRQRRPQPHQLLGAHGSQHQPRFDGGGRIFSSHARVRSGGGGRVRHH